VAGGTLGKADGVLGALAACYPVLPEGYDGNAGLNLAGFGLGSTKQGPIFNANHGYNILPTTAFNISAVASTSEIALKALATCFSNSAILLDW
jgi:hypothetical protein